MRRTRLNISTMTAATSAGVIDLGVFFMGFIFVCSLLNLPGVVAVVVGGGGEHQ